MFDIEEHLKQRGVNIDKTKVILDKNAGIATFLLYNLSGQLVGYQRYNPLASKEKRNDITGKYFTWVGKESEKTSKIAVWGLETVFENSLYIFVTEGIFDCIKLQNEGYSAIATLSNNPRPILAWFRGISKATIAVVDNDESGQKLGNLTDYTIKLPIQYHDLGDMPQEEVGTFIKNELNYIFKKY